MAKEIKDTKSSGSLPAECNDPTAAAMDGGTMWFPIYNFGATAEDHRVLELAGSKDVGSIEALFKRASIYYYRTIASDQKLADELVQELSLHDINPSTTVSHRADGAMPIETPRDHIALISE